MVRGNSLEAKMSFGTWISQVLKESDGKQPWLCCHKQDYLKATFSTAFLHVFPNIRKEGAARHKYLM